MPIQNVGQFLQSVTRVGLAQDGPVAGPQTNGAAALGEAMERAATERAAIQQARTKSLAAAQAASHTSSLDKIFGAVEQAVTGAAGALAGLVIGGPVGAVAGGVLGFESGNILAGANQLLSPPRNGIR